MLFGLLIYCQDLTGLKIKNPIKSMKYKRFVKKKVLRYL